jgi:uncharacterized protein with PIN domain
MLHSGKCPKCERIIGHAKTEAIELAVSSKEKYKGVSYSCPSCHSVLGVGIDFLALKNDIVSSLVDRLRRG